MQTLQARVACLAADFLRRFRSAESGATAMEYGLMIALLALVLVGVITAVGTSLNTSFGSVNAKLQ